MQIKTSNRSESTSDRPSRRALHVFALFAGIAVLSSLSNAATPQFQEVASPTTERLNSVWGSETNDIHAVGQNGTLIHFDGETWSVSSDKPNTTGHLSTIYSAQSEELYFGGTDGIFRKDAGGWSGNIGPDGVTGVTGITKTPNGELHIVAGRRWMTFDGSAWRTNGLTYAPYISLQLLADRPLAELAHLVDVFGNTTVILAGEDGVFPGGRAIGLAGGNAQFNSIWTYGTNNVMSGSDSGVYHYRQVSSSFDLRNSQNWKPMAGSGRIESIHGDSPGNVHAVGSQNTTPPGRIYHYDGNETNYWSAGQLVEDRLFGVWTRGEFAVAVGDGIYMKVAPSGNQPPALDSVANQSWDEGVANSLTLTAMDPDSEQTLSFEKISGPDEVIVLPDGGLQFTPSESQGPGVYPIQVRVTDDGDPPLSDDAQFQITVNEVNLAPALPIPADQQVPVGGSLVLNLGAADPDLPANQLSYSISAPLPPGALIDSSSGLFLYRAGADPESVQLQVMVQDDQTPPLSDLATVFIETIPSPTPGVTSVYDPSQGFSLDAVGTPGSTFVVDGSSNLKDWLPLLTLFSGDGLLAWADPESTALDERFYRITEYEPLDPISFKGNMILLSGNIGPLLGPDPSVRIDLGGDDTFSTVVQADDDGKFCVWLDASAFGTVSELKLYYESSGGLVRSPVLPQVIIGDTHPNTADVIPVNQISGGLGSSPEPNICTCVDCQNGGMLAGSSLSGFTTSYTPVQDRVELSTGKIRQRFPIASFGTRKLGFDFHLLHASLVDYDGPFGRGMSHSFNMMIVRTGATAGQIITPDLRIFSISSSDGVNWNLPDGFFSQLVLDEQTGKWRLTHFSGLVVDFYEAPTGLPGRPVGIQDPNGNRIVLNYDGTGLLKNILTDLGQEQHFQYDSETCRLVGFIDHIGRAWTFTYDPAGNLQQIVAPAIEYADVPVGHLITDTELEGVLVSNVRATTFAHEDSAYPSHITRITDARGAVPREYSYDSQGRVNQAVINRFPQTYAYRVENDAQATPQPLPVLDVRNRVTRIIDRVGNVGDVEMFGPLSAYQHGIRRRITWTESGRGNPPLRTGEPDYFEQRWLQDCGCLSPAVVVHRFSSNDLPGLTFDANGIPQNWPRTMYAYNANRQVTENHYTDGSESIRTVKTFQSFSFGENDEYSRMLTSTDPRAFDTHPVNAGLSFMHQYEYDTRGNQITHIAPTVTLGVSTPQSMVETWTYNVHGQTLSETDANNNITRYTYHAGPSSGGDINTMGAFGGYPATVTRGATGSSDPSANLVTEILQNALGMITRRTDPRGFHYDSEYNLAGDVARTVSPAVTLQNNTVAQYENRYTYDSAGNTLLAGRSNIDVDGSIPVNTFIDNTYAYDDIGNRVAERAEVNENDGDDLISRLLFDPNDQQIVAQRPEGNRTFYVHDERKRLLKMFHGVAPGQNINSGYPADKRAENLGATSFIALTKETYDARATTWFPPTAGAMTLIVFLTSTTGCSP